MPPLPPSPPPAPALMSQVVHQGPCSVSTALALGPDLYVAVDDRAAAPVPLGLYRLGQPGPAVARGSLPARAVEPLDPAHPELALEGSTRIGPLAYWIGSHGTGDDGGPRPNRQRLFATTLGLASGAGGQGMVVTAQPVGRPYTTLLRDLAADARYGPLDLANASSQGPKAPGGPTIEGLAATPSGSLLIGFRNPVPGGKALVAPLANPGGVLVGEVPRFGDPVRLDLGGLGIRSLEMVNGKLLILAGPAGGPAARGPATPSALFRWNGQFDSPPERLKVFTATAAPEPTPGRTTTIPALPNPEALLSDGQGLVLLSDDGAFPLGGKPCRDLPPERQQFRELRLSPLP